MNVLLSARNSFIVTTIILAFYMLYSIYKEKPPGELILIQSIISLSFFGSLMFYRNKREGKNSFGTLMPLGIMIMVASFLVLIGFLFVK